MRAVVIGLGNTLCGDDGAGGAVIDLLPPDIPTRVAGDGLDLIDLWSGYDHAIVVDAMVSGREPGTVRVFNGFQLPPGRFLNSHSMGLPEAISLARLVGQAPVRLDIVGIEARSLGAFEPMSPQVTAALPAAVRMVHSILASGSVQRTAANPARSGRKQR